MSSNFPYFNGIGTDSPRSLPVQTLPASKKKDGWKKRTMDALYQEAIKQRNRNYIFADIRRMTEGEFTYSAVDIERSFSETPWMEKQYNHLGKDVSIPTHIKHFDFIGIIVNAIKGIYSDMDDLYRVESIDEYMTNEYIRQRTEGLHKYAQAVFKAEIDRMLISNGINPNQTEFASEEEKQAYLQQLDAKVKEFTPQEIENNLSKNFKVLATEWAQNVLESDKKRFNLDKEDRKAFVDYLLTGRWFRHYKVGYDYYTVEYWRPEEVFFSQDLDSEYPQDSDFIGRLTRMSSNQLLQRYGHLMTPKEQAKIGNYWNQTDKYLDSDLPTTSGGSVEKAVFAQPTIVPFTNYHDHQINLQMESALGAPLAKSMDDDGNVTRHFMPRQENDFISANSAQYSRYLRDDIEVRLDSIEVMDVYFRSMKRIFILIHDDENGQLTIDTVTEDLLSDYLEENEIKKLKTISMEELRTALRDGNIYDYRNTIHEYFFPEIWHGVMIKGGYGTIDKDILLDVKPLEYQIKGDSNLFEVRIPVGGLISNGIVPKILPYQQLHNICMNQNTELLSKELGIFYSFDINALAAEYKDQDTAEALYEISDTIKDTGLLGFDLSRANVQGSTTYPNLFQRNEVVFANQIQYRQQLAEFYKMQGYQQVGITPQMLGQPNTYVTAEGVKQGAQASYALINGLIEDFNTSKAKANELHIAIAQFCETNGRETTKLTRKPDHLLHFIDILAEDPELFPLRKLSVLPASNSRDRKIVETIQQILMNDNTIEKDFQAVIDIVTNPYIIELRQLGEKMRAEKKASIAEERQFQSEQLDKQIAAEQEKIDREYAHEMELADKANENKLSVSYVNALGRDANSTTEDNFSEITRAYKAEADNQNKQKALGIQDREVTRKENNDLTNKKMELEKLKLKAQEIKQRREAKQIDLRVAQVNWKQ